MRQATFFFKDVDKSDARFDMNKDVVDDQLISEVETSPEEEERVAVDEDVNAEEAVVAEGDEEKATWNIGFIFTICYEF